MKKTKKFMSIFAILFVAIFALSCCFFAACGSKDDDENDDVEVQDDESKGDDGDNGDDEEESATEVATAEDLTAALAAGGSFKLAADITGTFTVTAKTSVTLDLAGYSITDKKAVSETGLIETFDEVVEEETQYTVTVESGAALTIKDSSGTGSIICTYLATSNTDSRKGAAIYTCGTLVIESGTITSSSVGILAEGGTAEMSGGEINSTYYAIFEAHGVVAVDVCGDAVIDSDRGIYVGGDAYYGYGDQSDPNSWCDDAKCVLNVYGDAKISTSFGSAISTLGFTGKTTATINISGNCTISGRPVEYSDSGKTMETPTVMPAIYIPNGTLDISGGTIEGTTAVEIRGGDAKITGGTLKTTSNIDTPTTTPNSSGAASYGYALAIYAYGSVNRPDKTETTSIDNALDVKISNDTFVEGPIYCGPENVSNSKNDAFSITGGTFSEDPSEYLDEEYAAEVCWPSGTYTSDGKCYEVKPAVTYALYLDFTNDELANVFAEEGARAGSDAPYKTTIDSNEIFTVFDSGNNDAGAKISIKNGGLNFGGSASSDVCVKLDLSSFENKNITIGYTAYENNQTDANKLPVTTGISATAGGTTNYLAKIEMSESKVINTLNYTVDITSEDKTLYINSDNKTVMLTFWIIENKTTQS